MEAVIFCGIQASGKTTFYLERFFNTHIRISLDVLRTRARQRILIEACLTAQQPFVVDNTNVTRAERATYIALARTRSFRVTGYFFAADPKKAFERNRRRPGKAAVPAAGLFGTQKRLQVPSLEEGFDALYRVELIEPAQFAVTPMTGESGV
jgi:predicted kinase